MSRRKLMRWTLADRLARDAKTTRNTARHNKLLASLRSVVSSRRSSVSLHACLAVQSDGMASYEARLA